MSTIHNPTQFNPADYVVIDYFDNQSPRSYDFSTPGAVEAHNAMVQQWHHEREGLFPENNCYRCEHCGQGNVRWVACVKHVPTGKHVCFGNQCVFRLGFATQDDFRAARVRQRSEARAESLRALVERDAFIARTPGLVELIARADKSSNSFVRDVMSKLDRWGSLSEAQIVAVRRALDRDDEKAATAAEEPKPTAPIEEGRREITGTVLGLKSVESRFGTTTKMLVRLSCLNKLWMTCPSAFEGGRGDSITCTVTVQRSNNDPHFGFGSRPKFKLA